MEQDPFAVVEALTIAGYATGCEQGYIYIRGEYPLATTRLRHAIDEARRHGLLGDDVMGAGFAFDVELRRGAGAYICGEETALFNSIEGKRGEPRNKPPFPVQRGVFGKPTGINNVETLINVLEILRIGGAAYAAIGTEGSDRAAAVLRERHRDARPGSTRSSPASRCARSSSWPAAMHGNAEGDPARRRGRRLRHPGRPGHPADVRGRAQRRLHAGLGCRDGVQRVGGPGRHRPADRPLLPRRVVRAMRALPRRDRAAGGGAPPVGAADGRSARSSRSSR